MITTVVDKAAGNPLYATYLVRTALNVAGQEPHTPAVADLAEHLISAPAFDSDLKTYYITDGYSAVWLKTPGLFGLPKPLLY